MPITAPSTASDKTHVSGWALAYARMATLAALDVANRRLIRTQPRSIRHRDHPTNKIPLWQVHTLIPTRGVDLDGLLAGAYKLLDNTNPHGDCIRTAVDRYVRAIIAQQRPYEPAAVDVALIETGCLDG